MRRRSRWPIWEVLLFAVLLGFGGFMFAGDGDVHGETAKPFTLTSSDFEPGGAIPTEYTCEGRDIAPALAWSGVPPGTRSLALVLNDPDAPNPAAPTRTWVHWVLYDLPPQATGLPAGVDSRSLPAGTREGKNDWGRTGYGGPCPPIGRHRYFHKLYALNVVLPDLGQPSEGELLAAMKGHVIAETQLIGTYKKQH